MTQDAPTRDAGDRRRRAGANAGRAGSAAEDAALRRYQRHGGRALARNWRAGRGRGGGEIDLVVALPETVVFVEVKARRTHAQAAESVTQAQWRRIAAAAQCYLETIDAGGRDVRFDLALYDRGGRLEVIENVQPF